jgi:hypothetical protein
MGWTENFTKLLFTAFLLAVLAISGVPLRFPKGSFPNLPNRVPPKEKKFSAEDTVKKRADVAEKIKETALKIDEQIRKDQLKYDENPAAE